MTKSPKESQHSSPTTTTNEFQPAETDAPRTVAVHDILAPQAPKRRRGRPPKSEEPKKSQPDSVQPEQPQAAQPIVMGQPFNVAPSAIKPLLKSLFSFPALATGCDEIKLTEEEATDLAKSTDDVLKLYASAMNSPHAPLYALVISFCGIGFAKWMLYLQWKSAQAPDPREAVEIPPANPSNPFATEIV